MAEPSQARTADGDLLTGQDCQEIVFTRKIRSGPAFQGGKVDEADSLAGNHRQPQIEQTADMLELGELHPPSSTWSPTISGEISDATSFNVLMRSLSSPQDCQ